MVFVVKFFSNLPVYRYFLQWQCCTYLLCISRSIVLSCTVCTLCDEEYVARKIA